MKNVRDTFCYRQLDVDGKLTNAVIDVMKNGRTITIEDLYSSFNMIRKNFRYPLKNRVIDGVRNGSIVMKYNEKGSIPPSCFPWFLIEQGKKTKAVVILNNIVTDYDPESGACQVSNNVQLYCLLESALMGLILKNNPKITLNNVLISEGSSLYSEMFIKVFNKEFALNVNLQISNTVKFLVSKFFLVNLLGMDPEDERIDNYAYNNCRNPNKMMIDQISMDFNKECFDDLSKLLQSIASHPSIAPYVKNLTVRGFLDRTMIMYNPSILLAFESLPYFLGNINSVFMGAFLNNQRMLEPLVDKRATTLLTFIAYAERR